MGFLKSIGKAFKKILKSPIGQLIMKVGMAYLTAMTGGAAGLLSQGLGMLGGVGSALSGAAGSLMSTFSGFASNFLGPVQSFMSGSGLSSIAGFLGQTSNSTDLLGMAQSLFSARQQQPPPDDATNQFACSNLQQLFAYQQAQQVRNAWANVTIS